MSMPVVTYSCTGCDLTAWDAMLWGYRYYLVGHERYPMYVGMGWCHDCEALVPSEKRPDEETEARLTPGAGVGELDPDAGRAAARG
jgi:hypothetical protein